MGDVAPARNPVREGLVNWRENGRCAASPSADGRKTVAHGASRGNGGIPRVWPEPRRGERDRRQILSPLWGWKNMARIRPPHSLRCGLRSCAPDGAANLLL
jgi:hypothetical protein